MTLHNPTLPNEAIASSSVRILEKMSLLEHLKTSWQFFFAKNERSPAVQLPREQVQPDFLHDKRQNQLRVSWLGHSSLLMNIDGHTILTDPLFERRVSPFGPTRFHEELALNGKDLPVIDTVIISHDHYDHLNKYSVQLLANKAGLFIVPLRLGKLLAKWSVPPEKIVELDWWQQYSPAAGLTVAATPARQFSGRGLSDRNKTLWASWTVMTPQHRVFFSGDSGYFPGFRDIGRKYGPFDMTFLECGAYNERWPEVHMFPEQTVQAHLDLAGKLLQPIHWSTFNLSFHPWYEPMERLTTAAAKAGITVSTPIIGRTVDYHKRADAQAWWQLAMSR